MTLTEQTLTAVLFSFALRCEIETGDIDYNEYFRLAAEQNILPIAYAAAKRSPFFGALSKDVQARIRRDSIAVSARQAATEEEFLRLCNELAKEDSLPLVVKGIICRMLYPHPDMRPSSDEDFFAVGDCFDGCKHILESKYQLMNGGYLSASGMYIELNSSLFGGKEKIEEEYDRLFEGAAYRYTEEEIGGVRLRTLCPQDNLLYLILHAQKHFIHSGVGIRQLCDINLFADKYRTQIDFTKLYDDLDKVNGCGFADAVFAVGRMYGFEIPGVRKTDIDCMPLLRDAIGGGVYGQNSRARLHSSRMTLSSAEKGRYSNAGMLARTVFPSAAALAESYTYLKAKPWLLPVAWICRIFKYVFGKKRESRGAIESVRIGRQRTKLMQYYGLIR